MSQIHGCKPGDCWRWQNALHPEDLGYLVITDLHGPSVVRGWWLGKGGPPRLVEVAGDILEQYGHRVQSETEIRSPQVPR